MDPHLQLTISHISLTLASLVLDVILCIIIHGDGARKEQRNKKYLAFCFVMIIGMVLTCLDEALRRDGLVQMPQRVGLALYLSTYLANTMLCYFFSRYTETFFKERSVFWRRR